MKKMLILLLLILLTGCSQSGDEELLWIVLSLIGNIHHQTMN